MQVCRTFQEPESTTHLEVPPPSIKSYPQRVSQVLVPSRLSLSFTPRTSSSKPLETPLTPLGKALPNLQALLPHHPSIPRGRSLSLPEALPGASQFGLFPFRRDPWQDPSRAPSSVQSAPRGALTPPLPKALIRGDKTEVAEVLKTKGSGPQTLLEIEPGGRGGGEEEPRSRPRPTTSPEEPWTSWALDSLTSPQRLRGRGKTQGEALIGFSESGAVELMT